MNGVRLVRGRPSLRWVELLSERLCLVSGEEYECSRDDVEMGLSPRGDVCSEQSNSELS